MKHDWTTDKLRETCEQWQETLRLQDWDVTIRLTRANEMHGIEVQGECGFIFATKEAAIRILDPQDFDEGLAFGMDVEKVVVHELLHLHFAGWQEKEPKRICPVVGEQAIDRLAKVLVSLSRAAEDNRN